jgi:hypothetical protein
MEFQVFVKVVMKLSVTLILFCFIKVMKVLTNLSKVFLVKVKGSGTWKKESTFN